MPSNLFEFQVGKSVASTIVAFLFTFIFFAVALGALDFFTRSDFFFPFGIFVVAVILFVVFSLGTVYWVLYLRFLSFSLEKDSFVLRTGVIAKSERFLPYSKIQHVNINRGLFQRLFGLSTVSIMTARENSFSSQNTQDYSAPNIIPDLLQGDAERLRDLILSRSVKFRRSGV